VCDTERFLGVVVESGFEEVPERGGVQRLAFKYEHH